MIPAVKDMHFHQPASQTCRGRSEWEQTSHSSGLIQKHFNPLVVFRSKVTQNWEDNERIQNERQEG